MHIAVFSIFNAAQTEGSFRFAIGMTQISRKPLGFSPQETEHSNVLKT